MRLNLLSILAYLINTLYGRLRMFQWPVGHWLTVQLCCCESLCQTWETEPQIFLLLHVSPGLSLIVHLLTHLLSCQKSNSKQGRLYFESYSHHTRYDSYAELAEKVKKSLLLKTGTRREVDQTWSYTETDNFHMVSMPNLRRLVCVIALK